MSLFSSHDDFLGGEAYDFPSLGPSPSHPYNPVRVQHHLVCFTIPSSSLPLSCSCPRLFKELVVPITLGVLGCDWI